MTKKFIVWLLSFAMIFSLCTVSVTVHADTYEEIVITSSSIHAGTDNSVNQIDKDSFNERATNFTGKLRDDAVATITINENSATADVSIPLGDWAVGGNYPRYDITHGFNASGLTSPFTFHANIYADGDAVVGITSHWNDYFRWDKDGKLYAFENTAVNYTDEYAINERHIATLERGRWHTFALTISTDQVSSKDARDYMVHKLYIDGAYVCDITRIFRSTKHLAMKIGAYKGSGYGVIAIDDVYAYEGEYDSSLDSITITGDEKVSLSDGNIIYDEEAFADTSSLKSYLRSISTADEITICDKSFSPVEGTLPQEGVCIMVPPSGIGYVVYNFQAKFFVSDVLSSSSDGQINVTANVTNSHAQAKNVTMIVALRDSAGNLSRVYSSTTQTVLGTKSFAIENIALNGGTAHVFFIDDWSSLKAVSSQVIDVTNNSDT